VVVPAHDVYVRAPRLALAAAALTLAQAKKDLTEVTHKVYFDIEIEGKPAGLW
jgi:hypothetical protein